MTLTEPATVATTPSRRPRPQLAVVTWTIIAVCIAVWAAEVMLPGFMDTVVLTPDLGRSEPWRFITSAFAHSLNITHIAFNMLALYSIGRPLELALGRARFAALYLISALGGGVGFVLMATPPSLANPEGHNWYVGLLGASGAVFGLFGVLLVLIRRMGGSIQQMLGLLLVNAAIPVFVPGIAWQAHVGGLLTGLVAGCIITRATPPGQTFRKGTLRVGFSALAAILVILLVLRYSTI